MEVPLKRARREPLLRRIICAKPSDLSELVQAHDKQSVASLVKAAQIRKFEPITDLVEDDYDNKLIYHRACRSRFTLKRDLQRITEYESIKSASDGSFSPHNQSSIASASNSIHVTRSTADSLGNACIICTKEHKYINRKHEEMSQALSPPDTLILAAKRKSDERILAICSGDLVSQYYYHRSCFRNYTRESVTLCGTSEKYETVDGKYESAVAEAFNMLFASIRSKVIEQPKVVKLYVLMNDLIQHICTFGFSISDVRQSTKKNFKRTLEKEFQGALHFTSSNTGSVLVYPETLSRETLIKQNMELQEIQESQQSKEQLLLKSAQIVRSDIKVIEPKDFPSSPNDLNDDFVKLPDSLMKWLSIVLGVQSSAFDQQLLLKSIGQDCVYVATGRRVVPAKQILLSMGIKTLSGNVELIRMVNRLGHGISYRKLMEYDNALCLHKITSMPDSGVALPTNIFPNVPTTLAFDNIDRLEETLSGGGTSHRVNGIIVQPQVSSARLQPQSVRLKENKTNKIIPMISKLHDYYAGQRPSPPVTTSSDIDIHDASKNAAVLNLLWSLLRYISPSGHSVPSWTGFNILTHDHKDVKKDTVAYLPTINAPATDLSTVNEILSQTMKIKSELNLDAIVCVFDQALYAKASEIIWKNSDMMKSIVIRMGVFHTILNLLGIIGKRFGDAGLRDVAVESGLIAEGSINSVLDGRSYNRGVRLCKLVFEAFMRLIWTDFFSKEQYSHHLTQVKTVSQSVIDDPSHKNMDEMFTSNTWQTLLCDFHSHLDELRNKRGSLASFWMSFVDMASLLLGLIRASREGN